MQDPAPSAQKAQNSVAEEAAALRALRQQVELLEQQNRALRDREPDAMRNEEVSKRFVELNSRTRQLTAANEALKAKQAA